MTKYYFGYNKFTGQTFPVKWYEEGGKPVGGRPIQIMQKVEITFDQFRNTALSVLEAEHPFIPEVSEQKPEV